MIADIHNKISRNASNLSDRLEDNLTGNFFGALRYLPYNTGLKQILVKSVYPKELAQAIEKIDCQFWDSNIIFWPYDEEGEIDALLEFPNSIIGIEVKLFSGLSSDDGISNGENFPPQQEWETIHSMHQLARESRIVSRLGNGKEKLLLFIAPDPECTMIYQDTLDRKILSSDVQFGAISWQDILASLRDIKMSTPYEQLVLTDLIRLLISKGFEKFRSFELDMEIEIDLLKAYLFQKNAFNFADAAKEKKVKGDMFYEFR